LEENKGQERKKDEWEKEEKNLLSLITQNSHYNTINSVTCNTSKQT
jgi:hypothetical protein